VKLNEVMNILLSLLLLLDGFLANESSTMKDILCPAPYLKKVRNLSFLEHIHRFFFYGEGIEFTSSLELWSESLMTWQFGNPCKFGLETRLLKRDERGELIDDPDQDSKSPEFQYVRRFNAALPEVEKVIPLISRLRELMKISATSHFFENLQKKREATTTVQPRNSSCKGACVPENSNCNWSYWVPAVYHRLNVTEKQKVEHVMEILWYGKSSDSSEDEGNRLTNENETQRQITSGDCVNTVSSNY